MLEEADVYEMENAYFEEKLLFSYL